MGQTLRGMAAIAQAQIARERRGWGRDRRTWPTSVNGSFSQERTFVRNALYVSVWSTPVRTDKSRSVRFLNFVPKILQSAIGSLTSLLC
jgi:hypothetical protein